MIPTRHKIAPWIQPFLNMDPSLLFLFEDLYFDDVDETLPFPVDLIEPNLVRFDILTV